MNYVECKLEDVPVGSALYLQYETVKCGVKTSTDEVAFEDGGSLSAIKSDTVKVFVRV